MKPIYLLYGLLIFVGCQTSPEETKPVFVGGDIINPSNNYVVLYDTQNNIDTLYLNEDNRFSHHFTNFKAGIHSFVHGGKYQSMKEQFLSPRKICLPNVCTHWRV